MYPMISVKGTQVPKRCIQKQLTDECPPMRDLNSEEQKWSVYDLLCRDADVFSNGPEDLGRNVGSTKLMKQYPRRLPFAERNVASQAVSDMHQQGKIKPSSPWSSPVVLVKKKDASDSVWIIENSIQQRVKVLPFASNR